MICLLLNVKTLIWHKACVIDKMIVKSVKYLYLERMSETKNEIYGKQIRCLN